MTVDYVAGAVCIVGWAAWLGYKRLREWRAPSEQERLRQRYVEGELGINEYERQLEALLDPRHERIRDRVADISGIGPVTADEIALSFESVDDLAAADRQELTRVPNIGPERAEAIRSRFD